MIRSMLAIAVAIVAVSIPFSAGSQSHAQAPAVLRVGPGGFTSVREAIAAAASGDTIVIAAGEYREQRVRIDRDLTIRGEGAVKLLWEETTGPCIEIGGEGARIRLEHLALIGRNINTAILGDPNRGSGRPPAGRDQHVELRDIAVSITGGVGIYVRSPGAKYTIVGGQYASTEGAILMVAGSKLVVRGTPAAPVALIGGEARLVLQRDFVNRGALSVTGAAFSGRPGTYDVLLEGDIGAVELADNHYSADDHQVGINAIDDFGLTAQDVSREVAALSGRRSAR